MTRVSEGFICPKCGKDHTYVSDTRTTAEGRVRRRRRCADCNHRFHTLEAIEHISLYAKETLIAKLIKAVESAQNICDLIDAEH